MNARQSPGFWPSNLIKRLIQRRRDAKAVRQLLDLPDSLLRDIGLTRYDVVRAVNSAGGSRPSRLLSSAAHENRGVLPANDAGSASVVARAVLAA